MHEGIEPQSTDDDASIATRSRSRAVVLALMLAGAGFVAFLPVLNASFVDYDDPAVLTANEQTQQGLSLQTVRWAFTTIEFSNYQPMAWLSHLVDVELFGMDPWGHHLSNLLLHAMIAFVLLLTLYRLTGSVWRSAAVTALFALHPLRVESVAWIAERRDLLALLFGLLTIWSHACWVQTGRWRYYALVLISFALGLCSKPIVVTLPCVLLLLDYWPLRRGELTRTGLGAWKQPIIEKLPLFAMSALISVVTYVAQKQDGAVSTTADMPMMVRLPNAVVSYFRYISSMAWPTHLAIAYPMRAWPVWLAGVSLLGLIVLTVAAFRFGRGRRGYLLVGWLWYVGTLVPVIGIVHFGHHAMADRNTNLPMIGLLIAVVWSGGDWASVHAYRQRIVAVAVAIVLPVLGVLSWQQCRVWQNTLTLFSHAAAVTPNHAIAHLNTGKELIAHERYEEAQAHLTTSLDIYPQSHKAMFSLGLVTRKLGDLPKAARCFEQALELEPGDVDTLNQLGSTLAAMGQHAAALPYYQRAATLEPAEPVHRFNMAQALRQTGRLSESATLLEQVVAASPDEPRYVYELGLTRAAMGEAVEAAAWYERVLKLDASDQLKANAFNSLGVLYAKAGRLQEAGQSFRSALALEPQHPQALANMRRLEAVHEDDDSSAR